MRQLTMSIRMSEQLKCDSMLVNIYNRRVLQLLPDLIQTVVQ